MLRQVHQKLRSRTGASITYALLLFLVCAVIGAVVLTAGTAAAGRVSKMAEMDQRYYSVTSAAELLAQELAGQDKTITITRTRTIKEEVSTAYTVTIPDTDGGVATVTPGASVSVKTAQYKTTITAGSTEVFKSEPDWITYPTPDGYAGDALPIDKSFLTQRAIELLFGSETKCNTDAAMNCSMSAAATTTTNFTLTVKDSAEEEIKELKVDGTCELKSDGSLVIILSNSEGDPYKLRLTFTPVIKENASTSSGSEPTTRVNTSTGYTETKTSKTVLVKTAEIYWTLSSVEKIVSAAST